MPRDDTSPRAVFQRVWLVRSAAGEYDAAIIGGVSLLLCTGKWDRLTPESAATAHRIEAEAEVRNRRWLWAHGV